MTDDDKSLGDQHTFDGETPAKVDAAADSLGDEMTYAGGANAGPSSLGDEMTFSGVAEGLDDDLVDDGMQVVDLEERYTIESVLGKGGMGEVLLATDKRLDRKVAIKRVLGKAARSKKAWQRFENGAKTIAKLNHPNIVQVYEYGLAKDGPFMILECVTGGSLLDRCKQGAIPLEEAIDITCQLCDGIGKAHAAGIVHRDIKPANVLMTEEGIPKLNDFDLAKEQAGDSGMTQEGAVLGTLAFMPPEQQKDAALVDARSDLWSLAATLYQMVTGEPPRVIDLDTVPQELRSCLAKALKTSKDDRYQSAREFRDALRDSVTTPVQPAAVSIAELGAGECPECHTKNESSRKFCNGCGSSLRVLCIECNQGIPVWEKFCAECGANQPDLIASRLESLKQQRDQAEKLRSEYSYETALQIAQKLTAIEDERLWQHKPWAEEFVQSVKEEWERQLESAQQNFEESKKHRDAFDYRAAIQAILSIPEPMRTAEVISHLNRSESDYQESDQLIQTIKDRNKRRDLDGLLGLVDRAVELQGNREDLRKFQRQLGDREAKLTQQRDEAYVKAKDLFDEGKAKAALDLIKQIKTTRLTNSQKSLHRNLKEAVTAETELLAVLKDAKADNVIDAAEVAELLPKAIDCYRLNPQHDKIRSLRDDLFRRLSRLSEKDFRTIPDDILVNLPGGVEAMLNNTTAEIVRIKQIEFQESDKAVDMAVSGATYSSHYWAKINLLSANSAQKLATHFSGETLSLPRVSHLSFETAEALSKHDGALALDGLTQMSSAVAQVLSKYSGDLRLAGIKRLDLNCISSLSECRGGLFLDGYTHLSVDEAELLCQHEGRVLSLTGLTDIDTEAFRTIVEYGGTLNLGNIAGTNADVAVEFSKMEGKLILDDLTVIYREAAEAFATHEDELHLNGLSAITVEIAEALSQHKGFLSLNGLKQLDEKTAEALSKHKGSLSLGGLDTIFSDNAAKALLQHQEPVFLRSITNMSDRIAEGYLTKKFRSISPNRLTNLSVKAAEALSKAEGDLNLDRLTSLSIKKAEALAKHKGKLTLNGLKGFKDGVADALAQHNGDLSLDGIRKLNDQDAFSLSKHGKHQAKLSMQGLANQSLSENAKGHLRNHQYLFAPEIKTT